MTVAQLAGPLWRRQESRLTCREEIPGAAAMWRAISIGIGLAIVGFLMLVLATGMVGSGGPVQDVPGLHGAQWSAVTPPSL
jgi:hypothetical protein